MGHQHRPLTMGVSRLVWMATTAGLLACGSASSAVAPDDTPRLIWRVDEAARAIPARDAQSVYFLSQRHELVAAEVDTGRIRWRADTDSTGPTFGSRVIVHGDTVIAGDYNLAAFDRRTGKRRWLFAPGDNGGAGMHLGGVAAGLVFTGSLTGALHAVTATTGRAAWSTPVGPPEHTTVYAPVVHEGIVAASFTSFATPPSAGVVVVDARTGRVRWRRLVPGSSGASGSPVVAGGAVIAASRDGTIHAFDEATGAPKWIWPRIARLADEQDFRPLATSGPIVVAGSLSGEVVAHDVVSRRVLWRRTASITSVAFDIAVKGDVVYVPYFSNELVALGLRDGVERWRIGGAGTQFRWVPLVDGSWLFASGNTSFSLYRQTFPGKGRR